MVTKEVAIINDAGLHTRPAATIVRLAAGFKSNFMIYKDGLSINGKSIIGVMTLAAAKGSSLTLEFDGIDENEAMTTIIGYFERGFDEL
ncbi:MAG: HPr family phosphocarrier protein [Ignavibacteriales bacterium]|nr:HPr family phosphocarrier protein [Ignavibacteriales bacterium]